MPIPHCELPIAYCLLPIAHCLSHCLQAPMDGENVVVTYKVKIGDQVRADDVIAEIESDKATVEVTASTAGTVIKSIIKSQGPRRDQ